MASEPPPCLETAHSGFITTDRALLSRTSPAGFYHPRQSVGMEKNPTRPNAALKPRDVRSVCLKGLLAAISKKIHRFAILNCLAAASHFSSVQDQTIQCHKNHPLNKHLSG